MVGTVWSLVPFAVVIPLAILTRQVIPGLLAGLMVGAWLLHPTLMGGLQATLAYLFKELEVPGNLRLIVFLYLFGSFVGLLRISGGVAGFARWIGVRIHSAKGAFAVTWLSSLLTFMAPDFRIITVAPVMLPLLERYRIRPYDMSYAINVTSTPLISLVPLGTAFVGYMVGLLTTALRHAGQPGSAYPLFLQSIPFNFFALAILAIGLYKSFIRRTASDAAPVGAVKGDAEVDGIAASSSRARRRAAARRQVAWAETGTIGTDHGDRDDRGATAQTSVTRVPGTNGLAAAGPDEDPPEALQVLSERARPSALHLVLPIALLVSLTLVLTWYSGVSHGGHGVAALVKADASEAMLQAILVTLVVSSLLYIVRKMALARVLYGIVSGGNEMMNVILLLTLVWAVSGVATDLGFTAFVGRGIGELIPKMWIAPALFVFGALLSYFIGSSFGAWGILMPLGFTLGTAAHVSLPLIAGAVFASGTLGGFASPLSDNTVAMSTVMGFPVMTFTRRLLPTTLIAGGAATAGYAVAGLWG